MVSWSGTVYRATSYDVPLWVHPNRRDGRWNRAGVGCTQYLCLDAQAPFAEMLRAEDLHTAEEVATYRIALWQLRIDEGAVVDYRTFEQAERAGFPPEALVEDDHERCQAEAARLQTFGARGLLSPSAALPGGVSLTLFGPRAPIAWDTTVKLASSVPTQRLIEGSAPFDLVARVRFFGQGHGPLERYRDVRRRSS